jgi:hypothetical protein
VPAEAVETVLDAGRRASDLVVVDLPRYADACSTAVVSAADLLLLVVPAEVRAAASAARVAARVGALCPDVRLVVRGPAPSRLSGSDVARVLTLPLAGYLRAEPDLARSLERGDPPATRSGPLATFCAGLLDELLPAQRQAA